MSLFVVQGFCPSKSKPFFIASKSHAFYPKLSIQCNSIPARDRAIDFGKHKGKQLGSLPSKYLKWVSSNLRAGDSLEWAKLADQVLQDPVYKDRLEWEFVDNILNGDGSIGRTDSPVSNLLEMSERFGWDNDDKLGWSRIDFELLGTSKGGRIPRKGAFRDAQIEKAGPLNGLKGTHTEKVEPLRKGRKNLDGVVGEGVDESVSGKREERIQRQRLKRRSDKVRLGLEENEKKDMYFPQDEDQMVKKTSIRFPGREGLIKKVLNSRRAS